MSRLRTIIAVGWPVPAAIFIFIIGLTFAGRMTDLEDAVTDGSVADQAQNQVIERLTDGYDVLQEESPDVSVPTPAEIVVDAAEENDVPIEQIMPDTSMPRPTEPEQAGPPTAQPVIVTEVLDLAEVRALVEPIVFDVCASSDVCDGPPGSTGDTGGTGGPGPSGGTGAPGVDAPAITDEQLSAIVVAHCSQPGNCAGMPGEDGATGAQGATGEPGRPPTAEEVAQVVLSSCGAGQCFTQAQVDVAMAAWCGGSGTCAIPGPPGPEGQPGATGLPGAPAREVIAVNCTQPNPIGEITCEVVYGDAA